MKDKGERHWFRFRIHYWNNYQNSGKVVEIGLILGRYGRNNIYSGRNGTVWSKKD